MIIGVHFCRISTERWLGIMEKHRFSDAEKNILEKSPIPLAVFQVINGRPENILLSEGFRDLFGYENMENACRKMSEDVFEGIHPDDVSRVKELTAKFSAVDDAKYDVVFRSKRRNNNEYTIIHAVGEHVFTETGVRLGYLWYTNEGSFAGESGNEMKLTAALKNALRESAESKQLRLPHRTVQHDPFL